MIIPANNEDDILREYPHPSCSQSKSSKAQR